MKLEGTQQTIKINANTPNQIALFLILIFACGFFSLTNFSFFSGFSFLGFSGFLLG
jgi:phosphatidylglycerophosphate synthase